MKGRNMRTVFIFFFSIVAALMLAETLSRLAFRLYYGVPFHDRRIAEYPYADFVEAADPPLRYVYIKRYFDTYPRRFECSYNLVHWDENGMPFINGSIIRAGGTETAGTFGYSAPSFAACCHDGAGHPQLPQLTDQFIILTAVKALEAISK